jgi:SAM-dependent methyltransferase
VDTLPATACESSARTQCCICGGHEFRSTKVLWPQLIEAWGLAEHEVHDIDRQQGEACMRCGCNLRSIALAGAIRSVLGTGGTLLQAVQQGAAAHLKVLEINEAGGLTPLLRAFGGYEFGAYPEVDMHALPYAEASFDLVVHSDTLEHIADPVLGLAECRRVLRPGGSACFTVPLVAGRMSRSRAGLAPSYHGGPATAAQDYLVHTEFGADAWTYACRAGFTDVRMICHEYPAALALRATTRID